MTTSKLNPQQRSLFFVHQLNRIHCTKSHLLERLPELSEHIHFHDLLLAIRETVTTIERQVARLDEIFRLLALQPDSEQCPGLVGLIEEAFTAMHREDNDPVLRDLSLLFYLQVIEGEEVISFRLLGRAIPTAHRAEIRQLVRENLDEARDDHALLQLISDRLLRN